MSLDVYLEVMAPVSAYQANITHNLNRMADAAGCYQVLWRPEEEGIEKAHQLIGPLTEALRRLEAEPDKYKEFNPENGWGTYEGLVEFVRKYLQACKENPEATVRTCR